MVDRKRVNPGFDIGEVLQKKRSHICVDLIAIRDRQIGTRATPRFLTFLTPRGLGELTHGKTMPNVPCDARQLAGAVSYTCKKAGKWSAHASRPCSITQRILGSPKTCLASCGRPVPSTTSRFPPRMRNRAPYLAECNTFFSKVQLVTLGVAHIHRYDPISLCHYKSFSAYGHPQHADDTTQPITLPVLIPAGQCSSPITYSDEAHRPA